MTAMVALGLLVALGLVWTAIWLRVVSRVRDAAAYPPIYAKAARLRRRGFYALGAVLLAAFAASLWFLPYAPVRALTLGKPAVSVDVTGSQWSWKLSAKTVPSGVPIEFRVTASDVNHGFGLYDPGGSLVAQVQAMPGYVNRLIFTFRKPGTYTIRCLELCGVAHAFMASSLTVTSGK